MNREGHWGYCWCRVERTVECEHNNNIVLLQCTFDDTCYQVLEHTWYEPVRYYRKYIFKQGGRRYFSRREITALVGGLVTRPTAKADTTGKQKTACRRNLFVVLHYRRKNTAIFWFYINISAKKNTNSMFRQKSTANYRYRRKGSADIGYSPKSTGFFFVFVPCSLFSLLYSGVDRETPPHLPPNLPSHLLNSTSIHEVCNRSFASWFCLDFSLQIDVQTNCVQRVCTRVTIRKRFAVRAPKT